MDKALYRIIDANINRSREGLRVIEEYCRFILNDQPLTSRVKSIRHRLGENVSRFDPAVLLNARDSEGDIGKDMQIQNAQQRKDFTDCLCAAFKRTEEAMRSIAESCKIVAPALAQSFEATRFDVYTLEKDVTLTADARNKFARVRLYVLINIDPQTSIDSAIELTKKCAAGGADCLQLRCKEIPDAQLLETASSFVQTCRSAGALAVINDRLDIAALSGADGVHLGQQDLPPAMARKLSPRPIMVGSSTHNLTELEKAISQGCDYAGIGKVFPSTTKPDVRQTGLEYVQKALKKLADTGLYHVAIGGITTENIDKLLQTGVRAVAVCGQVQNSENPESICRQFKKLLHGT